MAQRVRVFRTYQCSAFHSRGARPIVRNGNATKKCFKVKIRAREHSIKKLPMAAARTARAQLETASRNYASTQSTIKCAAEKEAQLHNTIRPRIRVFFRASLQFSGIFAKVLGTPFATQRRRRKVIIKKFRCVLRFGRNQIIIWGVYMYIRITFAVLIYIYIYRSVFAQHL